MLTSGVNSWSIRIASHWTIAIGKFSGTSTRMPVTHRLQYEDVVRCGWTNLVLATLASKVSNFASKKIPVFVLTYRTPAPTHTMEVPEYYLHDAKAG